MIDNDNNNSLIQGVANPLSWPFLASSTMCLAAVGMITYTSYTLGTNANESGKKTYQQSYWMLISAIFMLMCTVAVVKFVE